MSTVFSCFICIFWLFDAKYCKAITWEQNRKREVLLHPYLGLIHLLWIPWGQLLWGTGLWGWPGQDGDTVGKAVKEIKVVWEYHGPCKRSTRRWERSTEKKKERNQRLFFFPLKIFSLGLCHEKKGENFFSPISHITRWPLFQSLGQTVLYFVSNVDEIIFVWSFKNEDPNHIASPEKTLPTLLTLGT